LRGGASRCCLATISAFSFQILSLAAADAPGFRAFTATHYLTVAGCAAVIVGVVWTGIYLRRAHGADAERHWRWALAAFCLGIYSAYQIWLWQPENFGWTVTLPLEFCDLAMLVAAGVLLTGAPWLRGLLYFWTWVFVLQAFLTPVLQKGPATVDFWLFWLAHGAIVGASVYDLAVGKFRPTFADAVRSYVISIFYAVALVVLDNLTGWNYGYVGPAKPGSPTLLDALGGYPLRLLWMAFLTAAGFALVWLPWARKPSTSNIQRSTSNIE
jgi:hypothetical integral membrane protein (TIGR02206 family)